MKKLILITIILLSMLLAGGNITLTKGANVRSKPDMNASIVTTIKKGMVLAYIDAVASYHYVNIIEGADKKHTSDHVGKTGWMWNNRIKDGFVIIEGCTLRSTPEYLNNGTWKDSADDPNFIAKIKKNAAVKIIKSKIVWYKVSAGWISAYCTE